MTGAAPAARRAVPRGERTTRVILGLWLVVTIAFVVAPVYFLVMVSVAPGSAIFGERPALWVSEPTLRFWRRVLERGDLAGPLVKSLAVATATTGMALVLATPAAYVLGRLPARLRYLLVVGLLVTRMFPEFVVGVSVATRFARLGLTDTYLGLVLAHLIPTLPFIAWILAGTFAGLPRELEEAAAVDGASRARTLLGVVVPAAAPGIAVAALFAWLFSWNEFLYARLLTTHQNTLPLQLFQAIDRGTRQQMAAVASVLVAPILCVVWVLQRHLRPGALTGAIRA